MPEILKYATEQLIKGLLVLTDDERKEVFAVVGLSFCFQCGCIRYRQVHCDCPREYNVHTTNPSI